jgi:hypothetical protein
MYHVPESGTVEATVNTMWEEEGADAAVLA